MSEDKLPTYSANKDLLIKLSENSTVRFVPPEEGTPPDLSPELRALYEEMRAQLREELFGPLIRKRNTAVDPLDLAGFPVDTLPPVIKDLVEDLSKVHRIDPALPAMAALATLSGAIGRSVVVDGAYAGKPTHCNLYILIGAPPSYGKSVASDIVDPLKKASEKLVELFNEEEAIKLEAAVNMAKQAIKALTKKANDEDASPAGKKKAEKDLIDETKKLKGAEFLLKHSPTYMVGSATVPAFEESLCRNKEHLFSYSPEAGERIKEALGKSAPIMDLLLSGYPVESKISSTLSRGQKNITPCLSLLWMTQPTLLQTFFGAPVISERGLSARVLPLLIEDHEIPMNDGEQRVRNTGVTEAWENLIEKALAGRDAIKELKVAKSTVKTFDDWDNEVISLRNNEYKTVQHEIGRCREHAIRISGVLATATGSKTVTKKIAEDAVEISRWCLGQMLQILVGREVVALEADKRELTRIINEKKDADGWATCRDIVRGKTTFTNDHLKELCEEFPEAFEYQKESTGGRPSERIRLVK